MLCFFNDTISQCFSCNSPRRMKRKHSTTMLGWKWYTQLINENDPPKYYLFIGGPKGVFTIDDGGKGGQGFYDPHLPNPTHLTWKILVNQPIWTRSRNSINSISDVHLALMSHSCRSTPPPAVQLPCRILFRDVSYASCQPRSAQVFSNNYWLCFQLSGVVCWIKDLCLSLVIGAHVHACLLKDLADPEVGARSPACIPSRHGTLSPFLQAGWKPWSRLPNSTTIQLGVCVCPVS